jgi:hypothetical protein
MSFRPVLPGRPWVYRDPNLRYVAAESPFPLTFMTFDVLGMSVFTGSQSLGYAQATRLK